jgi:Flp pilus assembly pilin Flp
MDFFYPGPFSEPFSQKIPPILAALPSDSLGTAPATCPYNNQETSMKFLKDLNTLTKNQKGQGVMEYVIISSLVGIVCITAVKGFGKVIEERVNDMKESITQNIKNK